jgi:hypothetical protein
MRARCRHLVTGFERGLGVWVPGASAIRLFATSACLSMQGA